MNKSFTPEQILDALKCRYGEEDNEVRSCDLCPFGNCGSSEEHCEDVIGAEAYKLLSTYIARTIPAKLVLPSVRGCISDEASHLRCPSCKAPVTKYLNSNVKPLHCMMCGQKLDWSDSMSSEDIIKALNVCTGDDCTDCPFMGMGIDCHNELMKAAANLLRNRKDTNNI